MSRGLDWKWIALGVVIMFGLSFLGSLILSLLWGDEIAAVAETGELTLSGGQAALIALISFLSFAIGGYIVGARSSGRTIVEPGISAAIAVLIGLLITGNFGLLNLLTAAVVPFLAGLLGGWLGERRQGTTVTAPDRTGPLP